MIIGTGIDSVEIERFATWEKKSYNQLCRIFSEAELHYCLENKKHTTERFAIRFAAKEALYKAIHTAYPATIIPLLTVCSHSSIEHNTNGSPRLIICWEAFIPYGLSINQIPHIHLSLTHTKIAATACVILEI